MVSADKMMNAARGPVWHQKQKKQGIIPEGLRNLDREATWSYSLTDGWIYGHGTFCLTTHEIPVLGLFVWMPNSAHEAKRLADEIVWYAGLVKTVCMDSKADDQKLYFGLKENHGVQLITCPRRGMNKSVSRKKMIREMWTRANRKIYRERSVTVEPMQGLVKDIFDLEKCWMRGNENNRWLFAAMGVAVQMAQHVAVQQKQSTWNIKQWVLGI
jgi:hypothetical protein